MHDVRRKLLFETLTLKLEPNYGEVEVSSPALFLSRPLTFHHSKVSKKTKEKERREESDEGRRRKMEEVKREEKEGNGER